MQSIAIHEVSQAEQQARGYGNQYRDPEDLTVDLNRLHARHGLRDQLQQQVHSPERHDYPAQATQAGKQHALGQQLAHQANPPRSERGPHRQFLLAPLGSGQGQVRHVRADDEQHEAYGRKQPEQRPPEILRAIAVLKGRTNRTRPESQSAGPPTPFFGITPGVLVSPDELLSHRIQYRLCLLLGYLRLKTRQDPGVGSAHGIEHQTRVFRGYPESSVTRRELEVARHHANHRELVSTQFNRPAQDVPIALEQRFPPRKTQDDHPVSGWSVVLVQWHGFVFGERSTENGRHVPKREKVRRNERPRHLFDEIFGVSFESHAIPPRQAREEILMGAQAFQHGRRNAAEAGFIAIVVVALGNLDQPV